MTLADPSETSGHAPGWLLILILVLVTVAAGGIVGATNAPGEWYAALDKPAFNPPSWVFGPVWTLLYAMVGWAGARTYARLGADSGPFRLWVVQLVLNLIWTPIFFTLHSLPMAALEIVLLLGTIAAFMGSVRGRDAPSFWLFVPYAAWVSFATVLTWTIWLMN